MDGYLALNHTHVQDATVQSLLEQAFAAFEAGQIADARMACESALSLRGESSAAHSLLGLIYEKQGRRADAIREFQVVLQLNPDSAADRAHLDRLQNGPSRPGAPFAGWMQDRRRPLLAAVLTAGAVMMGGLWIAAGALRPAPERHARVVPSNVRMPRGAPGAVSPAAGAVRLPPPPVYRNPAPNAWPMAANPGVRTPSGPRGFGGVPTSTQMNARMQALAPRLFGRVPMPGARSAAPRPPTLSPAPVRLPGYAIVPRDSTSRPSSLPTLPDARGGEASEPTSHTPSTPPVVPEASPSPAAPAPATAEERDDPGSGGSYIRIRPLNGDSEGGAANATPMGATPMRSSVSVRPAPAPAPRAAGPSLAEARLHQQNGLNLWRQRDFAAAYQEYEFAAQLYRIIAGNGGPEAAAAQEGLRASEQGMRASGGER
jgi:tetratricopeptide (TPR) repeat protein